MEPRSSVPTRILLRFIVVRDYFVVCAHFVGNYFSVQFSSYDFSQ